MSGTKIAGVIGWPITHSLSPALHTYWLREERIDGAYVPLAVAREDFAEVITAAKRAGFAGLNVTVPHKEAAFAIAQENDPDAQIAAATNLLVFQNDRILGRNTDATGLAESLKESFGAGAFAGRAALIVGAGGAARGALVALEKLGVGEICIVNRTVERAQALISEMKQRVRPALRAAEWSSWNADAGNAALVINTTSAGMKGLPDLSLPVASLREDACVYDAVYNPLETEFLRHAKQRGLKTANGLGMLLHQAVPAFEAFYGRRARVTPEVRRMLEGLLK